MRSVSLNGLGCPLPYLIAAAVCTVLESVPFIDQLAQAPFFPDGHWLLSRDFHKTYKLWLYTGPKICIAATGVAFLGVCLAALFSRKHRAKLDNWLTPSLVVVWSIILVPLSVAAIKAATGVYSPVDLIPYGGKHPHIGFLAQMWLHGRAAGGASFPAGHASGGFALMALYSLPVRRWARRSLFCVGMLAGWGMGLYQMARGEHFLTHTLTAMFMALAIIAFLGRKMPIWVMAVKGTKAYLWVLALLSRSSSPSIRASGF